MEIGLVVNKWKVHDAWVSNKTQSDEDSGGCPDEFEPFWKLMFKYPRFLMIDRHSHPEVRVVFG